MSPPLAPRNARERRGAAATAPLLAVAALALAIGGVLLFLTEPSGPHGPTVPAASSGSFAGPGHGHTPAPEPEAGHLPAGPPGRGQSTPKEANIIFVKTYKTGGSTVSSLLLRFGLRYNLTFVPLEAPNHYNLHPGVPPCQTCNISLYHTLDHAGAKRMLEPATYRSYVPLGVLVTIVREPKARYLSDYYYCYAHKLGHEVTAMDVFDAIDNKKATHSLARVLRVDGAPASVAAADTGTRASAAAGSAAASSLGDALQRVRAALDEFKLVLVLERLDESLVLMKRLFGWQLVDLLYLAVNEGCGRPLSWKLSYTIKCPLPLAQLPPEYRHKLDALLTTDHLIYSESVRRLDALIARQDAALFQSDLRRLRCMLGALKAHCSQQGAGSERCAVYKLGGFPKGYEEYAYECASPRVPKARAPLLKCIAARNALIRDDDPLFNACGEV